MSISSASSAPGTFLEDNLPTGGSIISAKYCFIKKEVGSKFELFEQNLGLGKWFLCFLTRYDTLDIFDNDNIIKIFVFEIQLYCGWIYGQTVKNFEILDRQLKLGIEVRKVLWNFHPNPSRNNKTIAILVGAINYFGWSSDIEDEFTAKRSRISRSLIDNQSWELRWGKCCEIFIKIRPVTTKLSPF